MCRNFHVLFFIAAFSLLLFISVLEIIEGKGHIDFDEYHDPNRLKQKFLFDERNIFRSLLLASLLICLLNLIMMMFLTPRSAPALQKPYLKGNALNVLADVMSDD
jgi:hypothetical protein